MEKLMVLDALLDGKKKLCFSTKSQPLPIFLLDNKHFWPAFVATVFSNIGYDRGV
jgi:hypothetical protein